MPTNPGERYPKVTTTTRVAAAARRNSVLVAFVCGALFGSLVTLLGAFVR